MVALASGFVMPSAVLAEETIETETIEIISTTPLQGIGLQKDVVPANVQTVKSKDIENQNNLSIADVMKNGMLGVNVNEIQNNPYQPNINFRGFTASPLLGTPQGLSVFVDGVRVNEVFGDVVSWDLIPLNAISGMNMIPGSNPVFGLNTLGGAISIQTKSGRTNPGGMLELQGGSWGRISTTAEYGAVSDDGALDFFISGNIFHEQGWRDFSPSDVRQIFSKVGWQGEHTDANLSLTLADNDLIGNGFVQQSFINDLGYESINTKPDQTKNDMAFFNFNLNHYFNDDVTLSTNAYYRQVNTSTLNGDANDDFNEDDDAEAAFGNGDGDISDAELVAILAECNPGADDDDAEIACSGALNRSKSDRYGYGFQAQLTFSQDLMGMKNQFVTGLGYDYGKTDFEQNTEFGLVNASRGVDGTGVFGEEGAAELEAKTKNYSLFATDTLSLNDQYHLTMSARYNYTDIKNRDGFHEEKVAAGEAGSSLNGDHEFNRINPAIGLSYTPARSFSAYASYNEGSRAPTAIELGCANPDFPCNLPNALAGDPPLDQVVSKTFEAGIRGRLNKALGYSASVYSTRNTDDIQFISVRTSGAGYFDNVGKTRRRGVDLGLNGNIGNRFNWNLGYSYIKATYESSFAISSEVNSVAVANGDDFFTVNSGDELAGIPNHQLKFRGEWQATSNWVIGTNIVAFSDQYVYGNENNDHNGVGGDGKLSGYAVVNLDTRYKFGNTGWQLFGRVNNIFDREYYSAGLLGENFFEEDGTFAGDDEGELLLAPGAPIAGWVGVRYLFGGKQASSSFDIN